jgi:hypothetical protein
MTKLCPRGKAAAKRKFKVYPSAYANAYASRICAGKIKDPSGVKRKDFRGPKKAEGGRIGLSGGTQPPGITMKRLKKFIPKQIERTKQRIRDDKMEPITKRAERRQPNRNIPKGKTMMGPVPADKRKNIQPPEKKPNILRTKKAGGGLMEATARLKRQGLKRGGGVCLRGMNRDAVGKNS